MHDFSSYSYNDKKTKWNVTKLSWLYYVVTWKSAAILHHALVNIKCSVIIKQLIFLRNRLTVQSKFLLILYSLHITLNLFFMYSKQPLINFQLQGKPSNCWTCTRACHQDQTSSYYLILVHMKKKQLVDRSQTNNMCS